jgi:hypothetical protein
MSNSQCPFSLNDIYQVLNKKVSAYNAQLLLNSALIGAGFQGNKEMPLENEEAKSICLQLIKKGGPAFQVGKDFYSQLPH